MSDDTDDRGFRVISGRFGDSNTTASATYDEWDSRANALLIASYISKPGESAKTTTRRAKAFERYVLTGDAD